MFRLTRLRHKLVFVSLLATMILAVLAAISVRQLSQVNQFAESQSKDARQAVLAADFDAAVRTAVRETKLFLATRQLDYLHEADEALVSGQTALDDLGRIQASARPESGLERQQESLIERQRQIVALVRNGHGQSPNLSADTGLAEIQAALETLLASAPLASDLHSAVASYRDARFTQNEAGIRSAVRWLQAALLASVVLFAGLVGMALVYASRWIVKPIDQLAAAVAHAAEDGNGELVQVTRHDEIDRLQTGFNKMVAGLHSQRRMLLEQTIGLSRASEHARSAEGRLALALDAARLSIWQWDPATDLIYLSPHWLQLVGVPGDESVVSYHDWLSRVHRDDQQRCHAQFSRCSRGLADAIHIEYRMRHASGDWIWVECHGKAVSPGPREIPFRIVGTCADISLRKHAQQELKASRRQLRALAIKLNVVIDEERGRLARELHDELGQLFTGVQLDLGWIRAELAQMRHSRRVLALRQKVESASQSTDRAMTAARRIATELRCAPLGDLALPAALAALVEEFQHRTGIACETRLDRNARLDRGRSASVFRICQEALTNVARHSRATRVRVVLQQENDNQMALEIHDDGCGMPSGQTIGLRSHGVVGMHERAQLLVGTVTLKSTRAKGTSVRLVFPQAALPDQSSLSA